VYEFVPSRVTQKTHQGDKIHRVRLDIMDDEWPSMNSRHVRTTICDLGFVESE
jgi:hypothetical protein